jgi:hypothetical protein
MGRLYLLLPVEPPPVGVRESGFMTRHIARGMSSATERSGVSNAIGWGGCGSRGVFVSGANEGSSELVSDGAVAVLCGTVPVLCDAVPVLCGAVSPRYRQ